MADSREDGFTLIEVLVALAILILGLAAFNKAFGVGFLADTAADRERRTSELAENVLSEVGRSRPLQKGKTQGLLPDGSQWVMEIDPIDYVDHADPPSPVQAYAVKLDISLPNRSVTNRFATVMLKPAK